MTAIVNDFLALQATFKAYEEKRRREIAGEPEPSKDANAGENAEGSAPERLTKLEMFEKSYGISPAQRLYPIFKEGIDKKVYESFRVPRDLLEGKYDLAADLEKYRGLTFNCRCVICRGK